MISSRLARIINMLPQRAVRFISKKVIDGYLDEYATIHVEGAEKLENIETPTIFLCNHLSNSDGLVLDRALKAVDPTFVAGEKLSRNAVTNLGINVVKNTKIKPNTADKKGIMKIIKLVKKGESVLLFPEGTRSRVGSLIKAKPGFILIARKTGVPIVPISIHGSEKLLPISHEEDMSAEVFDYADVHVTIGDQFLFPEKPEEQSKKEFTAFATDYVMKRIAQLLPEDYRGDYRD